MRALVCQRGRSGLSILRVYDDPDALVEPPFESWTLRTGKQVLCLERKLHKDLEKHHLGGTYEQGALYALEYDEMVMVLSEKMGPHDRERYEALCVARRPSPSNEPEVKWPRLRIAALISWQVLRTVTFVLWKTLTMILIFGVVAILLGVLRKSR